MTGTDRGGLLGHGSVLTITSYPNRTSPVLRGKWLLENILGTPPPPPPPDVPALSDKGADGQRQSVRERLEAHRQNPACATCHAQMDPLGFALEQFDAVGTLAHARRGQRRRSTRPDRCRTASRSRASTGCARCSSAAPEAKNSSSAPSPSG